MAALAILQRDIFEDKNGRFFVVSRVNNPGGASNTVALPEGLLGAGHIKTMPLDINGTAITVGTLTRSAYPADSSLAVSGGSVGEHVFISMHMGNASGL